MEKANLFLSLIAISFFVFGINAQKPKSPLDKYLDASKTIVIAKCLSVGPVNILLRAKVRVQILLVVKGKETLREITVESQYGMQVGKTYLLRTDAETAEDRDYFKIETIESVIPISPSEDIEKLKELSPRIIVLRTMNIRVDTLESEIRQRTYELDALKAARQY